MRLIDFLIFALIYMLAIAVVSTIFNPGQYTATVDYGIPTELGTPPASTGIFGVILGNINWGWAFLSFIGSGLSMNIPGIPVFIKGLMLIPLYGSLAYFIYCNIPFLGGRKEG